MKLHLKLGAVLALLAATVARADQPVHEVADDVNNKMVKLFGSGGFKGLASYGSGAVVSADGYVLTIASPMLDTRDLRVHLADGRRYQAKVVAMDPHLDIALVKINTKEELELPFFDIVAEAKKALVAPGTSVLAIGNQFQIASRDEPMSVQRGTVAAYTKLHGRRGIHEASFHGNVYVIDAITNNPGAAGGVVVTRKGQLLGLIGKELRNADTNTWINYAIPIQTSVEVLEKDDKKRVVSILEVVEKKDQYVAPNVDKTRKKANNYHGITLVANPVELTPPYVEEVASESPAAKAGLKPDDLIVYVNGEQVGSIRALNEIFGSISPEAPVTLEVRRGDKLTTLKMTMGKPLTKRQ